MSDEDDEQLGPFGDDRKSSRLPDLDDDNQNLVDLDFVDGQTTVRQKVLQWLAVLAVLCILGLLAGLAVQLSLPPARTGPYTILISLDGFRWDYLANISSPTPHLRQLLIDGVHAPYMEPAYPSLTFPNHYTIITGLYPENHGIVANQMWDPVWNETYDIHNPVNVLDGKWYGGEPFWVTVEKRGWLSACYFWPGSEAKIANRRPFIYEKFDQTVPYPERVKTILGWLAREKDRPSFITLYMSAVDTAGHKFGPDNEPAIHLVPAIAQVDTAVGLLVEGVKNLTLEQDVNIIVVSDHGMAQLHGPTRVILVDKIVDMSLITVVSYGPTTFLRPNDPKDLDMIYKKFKNASSHMSVWKKEEIPEYLHFNSNRRITPIVLLANAGWTISNSFELENHIERFSGGAHGYANNATDMRAIFMASGPAFKKGVQLPTYVRAVDVYSLLLNIYGINGPANNGTLEGFKPGLAP